MLHVGAAAARESEHAREKRVETRMLSVTGLAAIVVLAVDVNSGISLSYLPYIQTHPEW